MSFSTNPATWKDSVHQVLAAQALNLGAIEHGEVVDFPAASGGVAVFEGQKPDVIRLYDSPSRLQGRDRYAEAPLIVTLAPLSDQSSGGRIVHRDDRVVEYMVSALITMSRPEQQQDEEEGATDSLLARKCDAFLHDFWCAFNANFHLQGEYCPNGLVDDHAYSIAWDPDTQWPKALLIFHCSAKLYKR